MKIASSIIAGLIVTLAFAASCQPCHAQQSGPRVQGIWVAEFPTPWGPATEKLVLSHTGSFTKTFYCNGKMAYFAGVYRAGPGFIRFYHRRGNYAGGTETWRISFRGPNQMICTDGVTGKTWTYHRSGS